MPDSASLPAGPPLTPREMVRLLPDLTGEAAIRLGGIPSVTIPAGRWRAVGARRRRQVVVIADGFAAWRTSVVGGQSFTVAGPGDVLLPHGESDAGPIIRAIAWQPLSPLRLAVIDERALAGGGPELTEALLAARGRASGTQGLLTAAARITRLERRLLTALWILADRWGEAEADGMRLELPAMEELLTLVATTGAATARAALAALRADERIRDAGGGAIVLAADQTQALERTHATLADATDEPPLPAVLTA